MNLPEIALIALALSMDAFAVCLVAGASGRAEGRRAAFRLSFHFGLFQFLMPIVGWMAGSAFVSHVASIDHWLALGLLAFVGTRMIRSGIDPEAARLRDEPSRGLTLVILSVATSIDALAVGLSLAMLEVDIWYPSAVIGVVAALVSLAGVRLGSELGTRTGKRMEIAGGVILILIGLRIVVSHLST